MITTINEFKKLNENTDFYSKYAIGDLVSFIPMYKHQELHGISADSLEGTVVAVRFSAAKVFYDIVDDYYAKLFDNVSSDKVNNSKF